MKAAGALRFGSALLALAAAGCASSRPSRPPAGDPLDLVSAETLFQLGLELDAAGDSIRAEQYLSAALSRGYPEAAVIPAILAVCVRASRFGDALDYAEPYLVRHPDEWALRVLVASIHMGLGQTSDALRHVAIVIDLVPDQAAGHYLMGVLARDSLADPALARAEFTRYLELAPEGERAAEARLELRRSESGALPSPTRLPPSDEPADPLVVPASVVPASVVPASASPSSDATPPPVSAPPVRSPPPPP